jgi:hypothetical protein
MESTLPKGAETTSKHHWLAINPLILVTIESLSHLLPRRDFDRKCRQL